MAVSTRKILKDSIKDIEKGLWVCNAYAKENGAPRAKKPLGCAVGLVAINAGVAKIFRTKDGGSVTAQVPIDAAEYTPQARKALSLLVQTARLKKHQRAELRQCRKDADSDVEASNVDMGWVIVYNDEGRSTKYGDGENLTPKLALNWFKRALAALDG